MTDFDHITVEYATDDVLEAEDLNKITSNALLQTKCGMLDFAHIETDSNDYGATVGQCSRLAYNNYLGCVAGITIPAGLGTAYPPMIVEVSARHVSFSSYGLNGNGSFSPIINTSTPPGPGQRAFVGLGNTALYACPSYTSAGTIALATTEDLSSWSNVIGTGVYFALSHYGAFVQKSASSVQFGGTQSSGSYLPALLNVQRSGSSVTYTAYPVAGLPPYMFVTSMSTNGTIISMTAYDSSVFSLIVFQGNFSSTVALSTLPTGTSKDSARCAYDTRLGKWVLLTCGAAGSSYPTSLYFASTSTPSSAGWGPAVWSRAAVPVPSGVTQEIRVSDFHITEAGVWLAMVAHVPSGSTVQRNILMASFDGGANWQATELGTSTNHAGLLSYQYQFAKGGGDFIALHSYTDSSNWEFDSFIIGGNMRLDNPILSVVA